MPVSYRGPEIDVMFPKNGGIPSILRKEEELCLVEEDSIGGFLISIVVSDGSGGLLGK